MSVKIKVLSAMKLDAFTSSLELECARGWVPQGSPFVFDGVVNIMLIRPDPEALADEIVNPGGTA